MARLPAASEETGKDLAGCDSGREGRGVTWGRPPYQDSGAALALSYFARDARGAWAGLLEDSQGFLPGLAPVPEMCLAYPCFCGA